MPRPGDHAPFDLAAFDFDGTLTRRDSLLPFLVAVCGPARVGAALTLLAPRLAAMAAGRAERDDTKQRLLSHLVAGRPEEELVEAGRRYADRLATRLRPEVVAHLDRHRADGHVLVLVSASPELYLAPLGEQLGFDTVLATRLAVDGGGRLTGRIEGANCRGPEKVVRLRAWLDGRTPRESWAYGDTAGDEDLLASVDHAVWV